MNAKKTNAIVIDDVVCNPPCSYSRDCPLYNNNDERNYCNTVKQLCGAIQDAKSQSIAAAPVAGLHLSNQETGSLLLSPGFVSSIFDLDADTGISQIQKEFLACLTGGKLDPKFLYFGDEVARKHLNLMQGGDYPLFPKALGLLRNRKNLESIAKRVMQNSQDIRLVSLGIGNGQKDETLIRKILESTEKTKVLEYFIFDISSYMLREGIQHIQNNLPEYSDRLSIKVFNMDFIKIDSILNKGENTADKTNLFLLLGNTLGNFDEHVLLYRIHSAMTKNDLILIDNQLIESNKLETEVKSNLEKPYRSSSDDNLCWSILKRAGLTPADGKLDVNLSEEGESIVTIRKTFQLYRQKTITVLEYSGQCPKNSRITLYQSNKYTKEKLREIITDAGFDVAENYGDDNYALILARKIDVSGSEVPSNFS